MAARGRPRSFDRTAALERAMEVFWRHGYEGASMAELTAAMGIGSPSLYAAFGSKEALFREAVEHYDATAGCAAERPLETAATAREAVRALLRGAAENSTQPERPQGCLVVMGATNCTPQNAEVQDYLTALRRKQGLELRARLARALEEGELPAGTDISALTAFFSSLLQGLSLQARDGASRETLLAAVERAMAAWPVEEVGT